MLVKEKESVKKFAYFTANFTHDFIKECWKDDKLLSNHLYKKFLAKSKNGFISSGSFMSWFFDLDKENQYKLIDWIDKNYKG